MMEKRVFDMHGMKKREADGGKIYLEGYFARYNEPYKVCENWIETISPGAFSRFLATDGDVKCLWNHNHDIVLGSRANGTLVLTDTPEGLYGSVEINRSDSDAMNAYARIERGDVSGCSFGFDCLYDDYTDENGVYHTVIREVDPLYEVSPCTFPAYESTTIEARSRLDEIKAQRAREVEKWREQQRAKLKGENDNGN